MNSIYSFIPKKTFFLIIALILVIGFLLLILSFNQPKQPVASPAPVISQSPSSLSPMQKTIIGQTTKNEFLNSHPGLPEQVLANQDSKYSLDSTMKARPNEVVFRNNLASFERTILVGNQRPPDYLKLSDKVLKYGPAERMIQGSKFYGEKIQTHIYAQKGFAFIVNPFADEIYEIQTFSPTSVENYISNYGEDLSFTEGKEAKE